MDLEKLLLDVFHPEKDEYILVMSDVPGPLVVDNSEWLDRRKMAQEWHVAFDKLSKRIGYSVLPLLNYEATGGYHSDIPLTMGSPITLNEGLSKATLAVSFAEYSITSFLLNWTKNHDDSRVASLPLVSKKMEDTALSADYTEIKERCDIIANLMSSAIGAEITFSTGHSWYVDLRFRDLVIDDGQLPRNKKGTRVINLPSGEVCKTPYEGEKEGLKSNTRGQIPLMLDGELTILTVDNNVIVDVVAKTKEHILKWKTYFSEDMARANIAEFAIGCNPKAVVWGNVLEDEKAGFHWAYGRSDFLGGTISPSRFNCQANVTHRDIVYSKETAVGVSNLDLLYANGSREKILSDRRYVVF